MTKRALITGIRGQDGAYLARLLLEKDMKCTALTGAAGQGATGAWLSWALPISCKYSSWTCWK